MTDCIACGMYDAPKDETFIMGFMCGFASRGDEGFPFCTHHLRQMKELSLDMLARTAPKEPSQ